MEEIDKELNISKKESENLNSKDISKKIPMDISEIKGDQKSFFLSENCDFNKSNKNNVKMSKNVYGNNFYNVKKNVSKINNINKVQSKEIEDTFNDIKKNLLDDKNINNINNTNSKNIESNIKILTYIKKQKLLMAGDYEFEILFTKRDSNTNKILSQRTLYRSYQDIIILYNGLITCNPCCVIPKLPEIKMMENDKEVLEEKKKQLENYLGYICKHTYLSNSQIFLIFISDEFERYRDKLNGKKDSFSLYSIIKSVFSESYKLSKDFISNKIFSSSSLDNPNSGIEIRDKKLRDEKLRLEKIAKGTENFVISLGEEISSVTSKIESMKQLHKISEILKDSNFRVELNQNNIDEKFLEQKNFFSMESVVYQKMAENFENYINVVKKIHKQLIKYQEVTQALIDAFIRKEKYIMEYKQKKNNGGNPDELRKMEQQISINEIQLFEEISNYHENIENMFSTYANNYIDIKNKTDRQNQIVLMNKSSITPNLLDLNIK